VHTASFCLCGGGFFVSARVLRWRSSLAVKRRRINPLTRPEKRRKRNKKAPEDKNVMTKHSVKIGGQEVKYTATAGTMVLKLEDGTPKASVFYVAYTKDEVADATKRPITFAFNGGPGAGSLWLHVGALGPRRVEMGDVGNLLPPPYKFVDNEASILDVTDIVFIDPVTTGFSRPVPGEADKQFHGVQEDVQSVGDFIRLWATRNRRWGSPKFSGGRKLRHNARGRIERLFAAEVWDVFEWNYFDFVDIEFSDGGVRYGKRLAVHLIFADVHGDCLVSQEIAERFTGGFAESDCGVESVCGWGVCGRADGGRCVAGGEADGNCAEAFAIDGNFRGIY